MNSITATGILLVIVGLYAYIRGLAMGRPIPRRDTLLEIVALFVGVIGLYAFALGLTFIVTQLQA